MAVSEMAETFAKCMPFVEESPLVDEKKLQKLKSKVSPFLQILPKFNNKDEGQSATKSDVKTLVTELSNETSQQFFQEMFTVGHAMKSMAIHFLVANHITSDMPKYAVKSCHKSQGDDSFKTRQTTKSLVKYWSAEKVKGRSLALPQQRQSAQYPLFLRVKRRKMTRKWWQDLRKNTRRHRRTK